MQDDKTQNSTRQCNTIQDNIAHEKTTEHNTRQHTTIQD